MCVCVHFSGFFVNYNKIDTVGAIDNAEKKFDLIQYLRG